MTTVRRVFWGHLLVAAGALALGYATSGQPILGLIFAALGGLWFAAAARGISTQSGPLLYVFSFGLVVGLWLGIPGWLALLSITAALGAWDLNHFLQRLGSVQQVDYASGIGSAHLRRLLAVEGIGLAAGLFGVSARLSLPFWWEVLLVALVVIGVSRLIEFVRRQAEE